MDRAHRGRTHLEQIERAVKPFPSTGELDKAVVRLTN